MRDVLINCRHQFDYVGEYATTQPLCRDVAKEPFDHVQPRRRGWREVHVKSRMFVQPCLHVGMLMSGVVVGDQVQCLAFRSQAIDLAQKLQPLGVRVPPLALSDDLAVKDVERPVGKIRVKTCHIDQMLLRQGLTSRHRLGLQVSRIVPKSFEFAGGIRAQEDQVGLTDADAL